MKKYAILIIPAMIIFVLTACENGVGGAEGCFSKHKCHFNITIGGTIKNSTCLDDRGGFYDPWVWFRVYGYHNLKGRTDVLGRTFTHITYTSSNSGGFQKYALTEDAILIDVYVSDAFSNAEVDAINEALSEINEDVAIYKLASKTHNKVANASKTYDASSRNTYSSRFAEMQQYSLEFHKANITSAIVGTFFGDGECANHPNNGTVDDIRELERAIIAIDDDLDNTYGVRNSATGNIDSVTNKYKRLILHELGHSAGVIHLLNAGNIMYWKISNDANAQVVFANADASVLKEVYHTLDAPNAGLLDYSDNAYFTDSPNGVAIHCTEEDLLHDTDHELHHSH